MSNLRWFILILGPLPIVGTSWAVSTWFKNEPAAAAARNDAQHAASEAPLFMRGPEPRNSDLAAACDASIERLSARAAGKLNVIARPPFIVAGDLTEGELAAWHQRTIVPAVEAMQHCYFTRRPYEPITVLLFRGEETYTHWARALYGDTVVSIYGYYKPSTRTLLVNAATGDGTLVHELTHALADFDLPEMPAWMNEGLASLHEQCQFRRDATGPWIEGLVNWRLEGLQSMVEKRRLRPLADLLADDNFRGPLEGTNYAQARYFCLYMQERGVLVDFVREFRERRGADPRAEESVAAVFPDLTWEELDRDFQSWVTRLSD